jgi:phage terminase large subunit-like protein
MSHPWAPAPARSLADRLRRLPPAARREILDGLSRRELAALRAGWKPWEGLWARDHQLPPAGSWTYWLFLGGRGAGKTRSAAEFVIRRASEARRIINICAATSEDIRTVCVEGDSGILPVSPPDFTPIWEPSLGVAGQLTWPNKSVGYCYSAEEPRRFRGPQCGTLWACDPAAWGASAQATWNMAMFGFRRLEPGGVRAVIDTTPEAEGLVMNLIGGLPGMVRTEAITDDNLFNLDPDYFARVLLQFVGTDLEQQERFGKVLDAQQGALWKREWIDPHRVHEPPELVRVVVAVDPALTSEAWSDETGIVVVGLGSDGRLYVLADYTGRHAAELWPAIVAWAFAVHQADAVVAETNRGGELVRRSLRVEAPNLPIVEVNASRGKMTRAEPVALLYQHGRGVHVVGGPQVARAGPVVVRIPVFDPETLSRPIREVKIQRDTKRWGTLEAELLGWDPRKSRSPNGVDALVWGAAHLLPQDGDTWTALPPDPPPAAMPEEPYRFAASDPDEAYRY